MFQSNNGKHTWHHEKLSEIEAKNIPALLGINSRRVLQAPLILGVFSRSFMHVIIVVVGSDYIVAVSSRADSL